MYRVVRLHNETTIEPYRIVKVIVSNNFNRNTEECVSTSGSYHVVLTKTRTPSKQEKRKISHDLKTLGISGLYLTNLSGKTTISLVITFTFIMYLSRQSVWCLSFLTDSHVSFKETTYINLCHFYKSLTYTYMHITIENYEYTDFFLFQFVLTQFESYMLPK